MHELIRHVNRTVVFDVPGKPPMDTVSLIRAGILVGHYPVVPKWKPLESSTLRPEFYSERDVVVLYDLESEFHPFM